MNDSLNPCCCGRWSQRQSLRLYSERLKWVLILVVVEDGLREQFSEIYEI